MVHYYSRFIWIFGSPLILVHPNIIFGSMKFWFLFYLLLLLSVHGYFWFNIIFCTTKFLVHYYFQFIRILVPFRFIIIFYSPVFSVHYYFRFTNIFGSSKFLVHYYFWFTRIFGSLLFLVHPILVPFRLTRIFGTLFIFLFNFSFWVWLIFEKYSFLEWYGILNGSYF